MKLYECGRIIFKLSSNRTLFIMLLISTCYKIRSKITFLQADSIIISHQIQKKTLIHLDR